MKKIDGNDKEKHGNAIKKIKKMKAKRKLCEPFPQAY
jgi:hypothetical protein